MNNNLNTHREKIVFQIQKLNEIKKVQQPSKMQLFSKDRMLERVGLKENKRFENEVLKQKKDLIDRKNQIDKYLLDSEMEKARQLQTRSRSNFGEQAPAFVQPKAYDIKPIPKMPVRLQIRTPQRLRNVGGRY